MKNKIEHVVEPHQTNVYSISVHLGIFFRCEERMLPGADNPLTLEQCAQLFQRLQDEFYEEYKIYELAALAVALVFPLVSNLDFFRHTS